MKDEMQRYNCSMETVYVQYATPYYLPTMKPSISGLYVKFSDYEILQKLYEDLQNDCTKTTENLSSRQFNYMKDIVMGDH